MPERPDGPRYTVEHIVWMERRIEQLEAQVQQVRKLRDEWAGREVTDDGFRMYEELGDALRRDLNA